MPIEFLGCAASNGMPLPSRRNVHIYLRHGETFAAWPCRAVPLCAVWHSVDVPLQCDQIGTCNIHNGHTELLFFDYVSYHNDNIVRACIPLYLAHPHQKLLELNFLLQQEFDR